MKILIAYAGSMHADMAIDDLQWADLPQDAKARVVSVVEWPLHAPRSWGMVDTDFPHEWTFRVAAAERSAQAACDRIQKVFPKWDLQLETPTGSPAQMILEYQAQRGSLRKVVSFPKSVFFCENIFDFVLSLLNWARCPAEILSTRLV